MGKRERAGEHKREKKRNYPRPKQGIHRVNLRRAIHGAQGAAQPNKRPRLINGKRPTLPEAAAAASVFSRLGNVNKANGKRLTGLAAAAGSSAAAASVFSRLGNVKGKRHIGLQNLSRKGPAAGSPAAAASRASPVLARLGKRNAPTNSKPLQVQLVMTNKQRRKLPLKSEHPKSKWLTWLKHINRASKNAGATTEKDHRDVAASYYLRLMTENQLPHPADYNLFVYYPDNSSERYVGSKVQQLMIELSARVAALDFFHKNLPGANTQIKHKTHYDDLEKKLNDSLQNPTSKNAPILKDLKRYLTTTEDGKKLMSGRA